MTQSRQIQANINQMQDSISSMQGRIGVLNQRRVELLEDRAGLEGFAQQVEADRTEFASQLERKREAAARADYVENSMVARGLSLALKERYGSSFEKNVHGSFDGVRNEIRRAVAVIDEELRQIDASIDSLETDIAVTRNRIAQENIALDKARAEEARLSQS